MPVFNGARYLRQAVDSILRQSFTDLELLLIDDGSSDGSADIINSYSDPRMRLVRNGANLGLIETLNRGLLLARGRYLARMDCDDISHPQRLALQVRFMERHPDVAACGTWIKAFGSQRFVKRYPLSDDLIRAHLLFENALAHPSVMLRRELFLSQRLFYHADYARAEDYELWARVPRHFKLANLDRILLYYRQHPQQVSAEFLSLQSEATGAVRKRELQRLGGAPTPENFALHVKICRKMPDPSLPFLASAAAWLLALREENARTGRYRDAAFAEIAGMYWWESCFHSTELGFSAWRSFFASPLSRRAPVSAWYLAIFWIKCLVKKRSSSRAA